MGSAPATLKLLFYVPIGPELGEELIEHGGSVTFMSLRGEVRTGDIEITAEVDCTVNLSGSATDVTVKATVNSDVDLSELECRNAAVTAEVGSQVTVHATGRLDAEASASEVWYVGEPTLGEIKIALDGSVEKQ